MPGRPLPIPPRYILVGVVGLVVLVQATPLKHWLSQAASTGIVLLGPLAVVAVALLGVWSGLKYVLARGWQD